MSKWKPAMSDVPQRSVLGPILFNVFINDINIEIECILSKFVDVTKLRGAADDTLTGRGAIQRDLDKLEEWADVNLMKFYKAKCKVLHLGQGNSQYQHELGDEWIESSPVVKNVGLPVDEKLVASGQCVFAPQKAYRILGCIKRSVASKLWEVILPLCSHETPSEVLHPPLGSSAQERHGPIRAGPEEGHKNYQRHRTPLL
ncbi:rna-directed dna polymerase from mobile element jockey-like [Limosa lapponica baueri]|uniref:Rna-directed dna polymerase from mobile element jockey-like n=1 Tax=Limosa lapponica baueri TaxID=1758121 RepID=A0A2I0U4M4_LIMLA|nr:rna-directed dna polymerase from mobile element jockey-like [Limosa lapponica baueri]